jgi:nicotinamide mononucleotide transporter
MMAIEVVGAAAVIVNLVLIERRSLWNYPFGLLASALYFFVFLEAKLYSGMLLQLLLIAIQIWGWRNWSKAVVGGEVPVGTMSNPARLAWLAGTLTGSLLWGAAMGALTDAHLPLADAALSGASIVSQVLVAARRVEGLVVWVCVNLGAVALFASQSLFATGALYVLLLYLSLRALWTWSRTEVPARIRASSNRS